MVSILFLWATGSSVSLGGTPAGGRDGGRSIGVRDLVVAAPPGLLVEFVGISPTGLINLSTTSVAGQLIACWGEDLTTSRGPVLDPHNFIARSHPSEAADAALEADNPGVVTLI